MYMSVGIPLHIYYTTKWKINQDISFSMKSICYSEFHLSGKIGQNIHFNICIKSLWTGVKMSNICKNILRQQENHTTFQNIQKNRSTFQKMTDLHKM